MKINTISSFRIWGIILSLLIMANIGGAAGQAFARTTSLSSLESLGELEAGNLRFREGKTLHPRQDARRRLETAREGQAPIAGVLACADSREAVELIFDQGLGDVFVIRVAGNTTGEAVLGSIDYAVEHLGIPLLVVLGHTRCGAVNSVWDGSEVHGNLAGLLAPIVPVVQEIKQKTPTLTGDAESHGRKLAVTANVRQSVAAILKESSEVSKRVAEKKLLLLGAVYDIESGGICWLDAGPQQP